MAMKKQASLVASEFNISVSNLKRVLNRVLELEIAPDIDSDRVELIIKKLGLGENYYLIDNDIFLLLKSQFQESQKLIPLNKVAKRFDIKPSSLKEFILNELGLANAKREGLIVSNVFTFEKQLLCSNKQSNITQLVNRYLISVAKKSNIQSAMLQDYSSSRKSFRNFSLLESVKMKTSSTGRRSGRIIGFGRDAREEVTPIVATYSNENEIFFVKKLVKLQANQKFDGFKKLDENNPFIEFIIGLNELANNEDKGLINVFIASLNKKSVSIKPINGNDSLIAFLITTNSFKINVFDFQPHEDELKRDQLVKIKNYGDFTREDLIKALKKWKTGFGDIVAAQTNKNLINIVSKMKRQIVWLPDEDIQALNDVANHADITVSTYIHMLLDATKFAMPNRALKDIYLKFFDFLEKQA